MQRAVFMGGRTFEDEPCHPSVGRGKALDLPGHGYSSRNDEFSMKVVDQATVVAEFCAALGLERYSLIGHSMGGGICTIIAGRHPQRVERLVLQEILYGRRAAR